MGQGLDGRIVSLYSDRISGHSRFTVVNWDDESFLCAGTGSEPFLGLHN